MQVRFWSMNGRRKYLPLPYKDNDNKEEKLHCNWLTTSRVHNLVQKIGVILCYIEFTNLGYSIEIVTRPKLFIIA